MAVIDQLKNLATPVISFVGNSNSGKTTLLAKVVCRLKAEGVRVAVIKHSSHGFEIDREGSDSWIITQAGADIVVVSSPYKMVTIEKVNEDRKLDDIIGTIPEVELILTEGFKRAGKPAVEVYRSETGESLLPGLTNRLAVASDVQWDVGVPCYHIDDVDGIVSEIKRYIERFCAIQDGEL